MSETMPNPTDWAQIYQHNLSEQPQNSPPSTTIFGGGGGLSDATVITATPTSPVGRVNRPIRRRSRASRRTPTTVFNTDTSNFRAMVQQFTGANTGHVASQGSQFSSGMNFGFGSGSSNINLHHQQIVNPAIARPSAYNIQFQQQENMPYTNHQGHDDHQAFFHRLGNSSSRTNIDVSQLPPQHQPRRQD